jgi:hypothetical protein
MEASGKLGTWTLDGGTCFSGQREQYFGAVAHGPDKSGIAVKVVKDPLKGWRAMVNEAPTCADDKPDCKAMIMTAAECTTFDIDIENTHTTINNIIEVDGHANLDCKTTDYELHGKLVFDGCH